MAAHSVSRCRSSLFCPVCLPVPPWVWLFLLWFGCSFGCSCSISRNLDGIFGSQRDTVRRHTSSPLLTRLLQDDQCLCIRQQAQDAVQIRVVCCVTLGQRILHDLNVLRARCSHQLTQSRCHRRTTCSHFERPCSPSFVSVTSFVSTRLKPACTSVCAVAVRCAFNSCATAFSCAACNATSSLNC